MFDVFPATTKAVCALTPHPPQSKTLARRITPHSHYQAPRPARTLAPPGLASYLHLTNMRYLVKARVKPGREEALLRAIADGTLGQGSIAGDEYAHDLQQARVGEDDVARWVETCFCATPLAEERPYWEEYFELLRVKDAHNRKNCRHENGTEPWACCDCDCTRRLEEKLQQQGKPFLKKLRGTLPGKSHEPVR